jgi:hypothetical protein
MYECADGKHIEVLSRQPIEHRWLFRPATWGERGGDATFPFFLFKEDTNSAHPYYKSSIDPESEFNRGLRVECPEHDYPVLKRGWCFQERLLSRRVLHFAQDELVWECKTGYGCECGYLNSSSPLYIAIKDASLAPNGAYLSSVGPDHDQMWRDHQTRLNRARKETPETTGKSKGIREQSNTLELTDNKLLGSAWPEQNKVFFEINQRFEKELEQDLKLDPLAEKPLPVPQLDALAKKYRQLDLLVKKHIEDDAAAIESYFEQEFIAKLTPVRQLEWGWEWVSITRYHLKSRFSQAMAAASGGDQVLAFELWQELVTYYSTMDLTYKNDILPAMSGIASHFGEVGLGRYYAGLWDNLLNYSLLWGSIPSTDDAGKILVAHHPSHDSGEFRYLAPTFS